MSHLYAMYRVEQSTTMTIQSVWEMLHTERLNCTLIGPAQNITQGAKEQLAITSTIAGICI